MLTLWIAVAAVVVFLLYAMAVFRDPEHPFGVDADDAWEMWPY